MRQALALEIAGPTELEIMLLLWDQGYRTSKELVAHLKGCHPLAITTVNTILSRLTEKGLLDCQRATHRGKSYYFTPMMSKEEYVLRTMRAVINDFQLTGEERELMREALEEDNAWETRFTQTLSAIP